MPKGTNILVCDGARAWVVSTQDPDVLVPEGIPLADLQAHLTNEKATAVVMLPPASAVVWAEVEDVSPRVLESAPLPFLAPYVPADYLERYEPRLWHHEPTDRGTHRVAYLLFDKEAVRAISEAVGSVGFVTPWEALASMFGDGAFRTNGTVYRVVTGEDGHVLETRAAPEDSAPHEWGKPVDVPLADLARGALEVPSHRLGKRASPITMSRWVVAAGVLLLGLALLHTGLKARSAAGEDLASLERNESDWSEKLAGRPCSRGELVKAVRRAIVMPSAKDVTLTRMLGILDTALRRADTSTEVSEMTIGPKSARLRFGQALGADDEAALLRAGFRRGPDGGFLLETLKER